MTVIPKKFKDKSTNSDKNSSTIDFPNHEAKIAKLSHYKTDKKKFSSGYQLEDWLEEEPGYLA
jgi:hypothetical protein